MNEYTPDEFMIVLDEYNAMQRTDGKEKAEVVSADNF